MARNFVKLEQEATDREVFEEMTLGSLRRAVFDGDKDNGSFMSGQVAGMCNKIEPVAAIFERIMAEYEDVRKGMPKL
jgi:enoyl-[acyl-carrier protein] reductase II